MKRYKFLVMAGMLITCTIPLVGCGRGAKNPDTVGVTIMPTKTKTATKTPTLKPTVAPTEIATREPTLEPTGEPKPILEVRPDLAIVKDDPLLDLEPKEFAKKYDELPDDYKIRIGDEDNIQESFLNKNYNPALTVDGTGMITKKQAEKVRHIIMPNIFEEDTNDIEMTYISLKGLRFFRNVKTIEIVRTMLSDFDEFGYAKSLVSLDLYACDLERYGKTEELSSLFTLRGMKEVSIVYCELTSADFFSGCSDLGGVRIDLMRNEISDISSMANLKRIDYLNLWSNNLTEISALSNLTEVVYLLLDSNQIVDITPLSGLRKAHQIGLSSNLITDISPLRNLEFINDENMPDSKPDITLGDLNVDENMAREILGDYYVGGE